MEAWQIRVMAGIVVGIAEIYVPGFFLACISFACLVTGLVSAFDAILEVQIIVFTVSIVVAFVAIRPFVMRLFHRPGSEEKTNVDALVGCEGIVSEDIAPKENRGRVVVRGDDWRAVCLGDRALEKGSRVKVVRVDGTKLFVEPQEEVEI